MIKQIFFFLFIIFGLCSLVFAQNNSEQIGMRVSKTSCASLSEYSDLGLNQVKEILLLNAKREAISQVYGEMIYSESIVKNWMLISDLIVSKSLGIIRIEGDPEYYNGENLGEICVKINSYVTKDDLKKFELKPIKMVRHCYTDPNMPLKDIKQKARESALLEIVKRFNPALKNISVESASRLVHNFNILKEEFEFESGAYCMDVKADIIPFEMEFFDENSSRNKNINSSQNLLSSYQIYKKGEIFFQENFVKYEIGDFAKDWGTDLVVLKDKEGKYLSSQVQGNKVLSKPIKFPENFSFEIFFDTYVNSNHRAEHIFKFIDTEEKSFNITCYRSYLRDYLKMPKEERVDKGWQYGYNQLKVVKIGNIYKLYLNGNFISSGKYEFKNFVRFEILGPFYLYRFKEFKGIAL